MSGYKPIIKSLTNIESKKTIDEIKNVWNKILLKMTIEIIGVKFGGWGISLEKTKSVIKRHMLECWFIIFTITNFYQIFKKYILKVILKAKIKTPTNLWIVSCGFIFLIK